jgi:glycosyltransferase involved in cell wall biosynthesis
MKKQNIDRLRMNILFPMYCTGSGVSYTCLSLARAMEQAGAGVRLLMSAADDPLLQGCLRTAVPGWMKAAAYRMFPTQKPIRRFTERLFVRQSGPGDIVYLWPGVSLKTYQRLRERGCTIVMERINCHRKTARRVLDEAYRRRGIPPAHGLTDEAIAEETSKLELADFVFSPSPMVRASLHDAGIPGRKIIDTSYGWDPGRHIAEQREENPREENNGLTVLFVGRLCIRKGVHLLLDVWEKAGIQGRLVLAGVVEKELAELCAEHLKRSDVIMPGFVRDVAALYDGADVFVFPSLEEGGPQVTYEAMACGLPVIVSPMGAGAAARDKKDGYVLDPYDQEGWVAALRELSRDAPRRRALGRTARQRAQDFIWERVGRQRVAALSRGLAGGQA